MDKEAGRLLQLAVEHWPFVCLTAVGVAGIAALAKKAFTRETPVAQPKKVEKWPQTPAPLVLGSDNILSPTEAKAMHELRKAEGVYP